MNVSDATPQAEGLGSMAYNFAVVGVQKGGTSTLAVMIFLIVMFISFIYIKVLGAPTQGARR